APVMDGRAAGGHTFRVETEDGELNTNGCVECHSDEDALVMLKEETQATLEAALEELRLRLIEVGILTESDRAVQGTWGPVEAGCLWNYFYLLEDQSYGIHNFSYAMKLIENSLEALN
ncbi:MAG: hypothetical protein R3301_08270, partial [Saprospiraceae bacterium]|nr:hypothetical protein [Saprospiraceae bacterium]